MKKLKRNHLFQLFLIALLLLVSSVSLMAQDDDEEEIVIDCESDELSDEDYEFYCADEFYEEEIIIDCDSDELSDEDYEFYCADEFYEEEIVIDCDSDELSDEDYEYYCADEFYEEYVDCESDELSDEDYEYYCEFDYEDYDDEYGDFIDYDEFDDNFDDDDETIEDAETEYEVSDGAILEGNATEDEQALWNAFVSIIPAEWVQRVSSFEIVDDPDTAGYVYIDENDPTKFVLGLNPSELEDLQELNHTIIHEFAHMLTLNSAQVDGTVGTCPTLELDEGCSNPRSYINQFNTQFWANGNSSPDDFVSDYASSNIAEDMAESFAAFILRDKPGGTSIAEQKINFFHNFKELVQLRQQIRANLAQA